MGCCSRRPEPGKFVILSSLLCYCLNVYVIVYMFMLLFICLCYCLYVYVIVYMFMLLFKCLCYCLNV